MPAVDEPCRSSRRSRADARRAGGRAGRRCADAADTKDGGTVARLASGTAQPGAAQPRASGSRRPGRRRSSVSRSAPRRSPPQSSRRRDGRHELVAARPPADRERARRRRRDPRRGGARAPAEDCSSTSTSFRGRTSASASRATASVSARSTSPASTTRPSSTTPFASRRTRFCRSPSTSPCSTTASSRSVRPRRASRRGGSCSSSPRATRSSRTSHVAQQAGHQARGPRPRGAEPAPRVRRAEAVRRSGRSTTPPPSIVSIGHESTTLLVAGGGACEFTRVFDWGGGTLQDAVMQELDVHPAEAATILRHLSLSGPGRQYEALDDAARARAIEAVRLRLTPFARELVSSLQFYQTQPDSLGIGEIVITGGTSHLEGLGEALHQMIGVSVRVGDPLARVHVSGRVRPRDRGDDRLDGGSDRSRDRGRADAQRRPAAERRSSSRRASARTSSRSRFRSPSPYRSSALGFMFVSAHGKVSDSQAELDAVSAQIDALPKPSSPVIDASLQGDAGAARAGRRERARQPRRLGRRAPRRLPRAAGERLAELAAGAGGATVGCRNGSGRGDRRPGVPAAPTGARSTATRTPRPTSLACLPGSRPSRRSPT